MSNSTSLRRARTNGMLPLAAVLCSVLALMVSLFRLPAPPGPVHAQELQPPSACSAAVPNPLAVSTLRWYSRNQVALFPFPSVISTVFDGSNMYVLGYSPQANSSSSAVIYKLRATDGALLATFTNFPTLEFAGFGSMLFDGQNIWVQYLASDSAGLLEFRASDGTFVGFGGSAGPGGGLTFDGQSIWIAVRGYGLTRFRANNTQQSASFPGGDPVGLAFDGRNVWAADASGFVTVHRATDGVLVHSIPITGEPLAIAFDGANMWVTNIGNNTVTKIRTHDFAELGTFPTENGPFGIVFDGANIWIGNTNSRSVTLLRACDGTHVGSFATSGAVGSMAFDGINVWVGANGGLAKM